MTNAPTAGAHQLVRCRFLNHDGASLVRERLDQRALRDLYAWFRSPQGGDSGLRLLRQAPLFDTILERAALEAGRAGPPEATFGVCTNFGVGLLVATQCMAIRERGDPLATETSMEDVLQVLGLARCALAADPGEEESPPPAYVTAELIKLDPGIQIVLEAAFRMIAPGRQLECGASPLRFLFHLGLVGAGVRVPATSALAGVTAMEDDHRGSTNGDEEALQG